jgi:hypothetical protein
MHRFLILIEKFVGTALVAVRVFNSDRGKPCPYILGMEKSYSLFQLSTPRKPFHKKKDY